MIFEEPSWLWAYQEESQKLHKKLFLFQLSVFIQKFAVSNIYD